MRAFPIVLAAWVLAACEPAIPPEHRIVGADPLRGRKVIVEHGCGACHNVPGVIGARGMVGPPLTDFGRRTLIAGLMPNRPDTLVRWLCDPPGMAPGTAMPSLGLTEAEARDVAAYLYTLR